MARNPWKEAEGNLRAAVAEVEAACVETQSDAGALLASNARAEAPIDTGRLKAGIGDDGEGGVTSEAPYTKYVTEGTSDTDANDFLSRARVATTPAIPALLKANVEARLRKHDRR